MKAIFNFERYIDNMYKSTGIREGLEIVSDIILKELKFDYLVVLLDNRMNVGEGGKTILFHFGFNAEDNDVNSAKDNFYLGILEQKLFQYKRSLIINDIRDKENYFHSIANKYLKSLIITPIYTKNRNIGMFYTGNKSVSKYTESMEYNLELIAKVYSMYLEINFSNNESKLFLNKGHELFEFNKKEELISAFYNLLKKLFPSKTRYYLMFNGESFKGGSNILNKVLNNEGLGNRIFDDPWFTRYFQENEYFIWNGKRSGKISMDEEFLYQYFDFKTIREYFRNSLVIPMKFSNRILGYLFLFDYRGRVYYENHVKSILPFIRQLTTSFLKIENNELIIEKNEDIKNFAIRVVHNIRNPSDSINTILKSYERDYRLSKTQKEHFEVLNSSIKRIQEIAKDYLRLTLPSKYRFANVLIKELFNEIIAQRSSNQECNLILNIPQNKVSIYIDRSEILSVFEELIHNSEKNNSKNIRIEIYEKQRKMFFEITDDGRGISSRISHNMFQPNVELNSNGGLGLSIVKKILREHKGDIEFDKVYKEGAKFIIWLPLK